MAAPKTVATYDLNGSTREFDFAFDYLARSFVKVSLIGTERVVLQVGTDYTFVSANRIRTNVIYGAPDYQLIEIRRETSTTDRLVDFQDASILRADDLDLSQLQVLHVAEEAREAATETIGTNNFGHLDARGRRIVNVVDPVDPLDVVNRRWYEADVNGVYQNRVATEQARDKAKEWATKSTTVESGLESSKTYAERAKASETAASSSASASASSAASASASAAAASASAGSAQYQAAVAEGHKNAAASSASAASSSASAASYSASAALTQANRAKSEADRAEENATLVDTAFLRNRSNHTGVQPLSSVEGLEGALNQVNQRGLGGPFGPGGVVPWGGFLGTDSAPPTPFTPWSSFIVSRYQDDNYAFALGVVHGETTPYLKVYHKERGVWQGPATVRTTANTQYPIGQGGSWKDVKAARSVNTTYTNDTGQAIQLHITVAGATSQSALTAYLSVTQWGSTVELPHNASYWSHAVISVIIPAGASYSLRWGGPGSIASWHELRP